VDRNTLLAFALSFLVISLWMAWEGEHRPHPGPETEAVASAAPEASAAPAAPLTKPHETVPPPPAAPGPPEEKVEVTTHLATIQLTSRGAGVDRLSLQTYTQASSDGGGPVVLIERVAGEPPAFATPLLELGVGNLAEAAFQVTERTPTRVSFEYAAEGRTVRKVYEFSEDAYLFNLQVTVGNGTASPISAEFALALPEQVRLDSDFKDLALNALVEGKLQSAPLARFGKPGLLGGSASARDFDEGLVEWAGAGSRYFLTAMVPEVPRDGLARWSAVEPGMEAVATVGYRPLALPAGSSVTRAYRIYAGPKEPKRLEAAGAQLDRSIYLGWSWVTPLTKLFSWLLTVCYELIPNYGVAIILLTVLLRLLLTPLTVRQMRSMKQNSAKMALVQPRLKEIQERYKDDSQRRSEEMMKIYREAGVNPFGMLGGCLPMLLQLPVFVGLFYALQSSISLRHEPFALWIRDLSAPETLFTIPGTEFPVRLLPLLMGVSMVAQQKMVPTATMDPAQARMMLIMMPAMMTFICYGFPSGLVLYWFVSNLLAIGQQLWVNRGLTPAAA
jgi:YidC/Oxa1 family membrane protein insertase